MHRLLTAVLLFVLLAAPAAAKTPDLSVLCFHDVRDAGAPLTELTVSSDRFLAQLAWMRGAGYRPVSLDDVLAARRGERSLPHKAVLLTFDDGYADFYTRVYPLLRLYGYPAVLSLVGSWMETPPGETVDYGGKSVPREAFLSWEQVREMADSGLVEIATHTYDMHRGVPGNPQGNLQPAAATRIYDDKDQSYENEADYRRRVGADLRRSLDVIERRTGHRPRAVSWPFGRPAPLSEELAAELGLKVEFLLEREHRGETPLLALSRHMVPPASSLAEFAGLLRSPDSRWPRRAIRVALDEIYNSDPAEHDRRLGRLLERVIDLGVNTVYLEAFADPDGDGDADAFYFPNDELPVRADLFNRAAWQLMTRGEVEVYAVLPRRGDHQRLEALAAALGRHVHCHGLMFDPRFRLRETTAQPAAEQAALMARARAMRPRLRSVALTDAGSPGETGSAYWQVLRVDARRLHNDPHLAQKLVTAAQSEPGLLRTVFFIDCGEAPADPASAGSLFSLLGRLQGAGARHLGYGPDEAIGNAPPLQTIAPAISEREYPYGF